MNTNDKKTRDQLRTEMQSALKNNDSEGYVAAFDQMVDAIADDVRQECDERMEGIEQETNARVLAARGVRQLTTNERDYYQKVSAAMRGKDYKQAVNNLDVVMPETIIDSVFEDLAQNHPLLSRINFRPTRASVSMLVNTNPHQLAVWGKLCDEIAKELESGFKEINTSLNKLTAFLPVCKAMLDLGPVWLDRYVREVLYEALACGLEHAIISGTGKDMPIGMDRQVGAGVSVTDGEHPRKVKKAVTEFTPESIGALLATMAVDELGRQRRVDNVLLIVSAADYYGKIMPATTVMAPDGTYRNNVMPYPMTVIQSAELATGEAIIGLGNRYFAGIGTEQGGRIEYSDEYRFLEDQRVYTIKLYGNGMPMDNNAFQLLDITGLKPKTLKVETVTAEA